MLENKLGSTGEQKIYNIRCELVSGENISFLEGKLKTFIESLGLQEKQEKASKDILQTTLWDWFNFITTYNTDDLNEKQEWYKKNQYNYSLKKII
jgi:hypothetical protein